MLDPNDPVNRPAIQTLAPADMTRAQSVNPSQAPTGGADLGYVAHALGNLNLGAAARGMLPAGGFTTGAPVAQPATPPVVEAAPVAHAVAAMAQAATQPVTNPAVAPQPSFWQRLFGGGAPPQQTLPEGMTINGGHMVPQGYYYNTEVGHAVPNGVIHPDDAPQPPRMMSLAQLGAYAQAMQQLSAANNPANAIHQQALDTANAYLAQQKAQGHPLDAGATLKLLGMLMPNNNSATVGAQIDAILNGRGMQ
jgi:hypothetical protein